MRRLQPDVQLVLDEIAKLSPPPLESLPVEVARAVMAASAARQPSGPEVGEILDGSLPGAAGGLAYRLYRPATAGPHPVIVYFHGGGFVFGAAASDDPLCRDLCVQTGAIVISVDYRHAPEHRFPAAVDDGWAAVQWVAAHAETLGGVPNRLAVAGWSAGGNIAAVVCRRARDLGGPPIRGQALLTPVTDTRAYPSHRENADGYGLTAALLAWFHAHYADPADSDDPDLAPLRAPDLSGLPPAVVVTCEFDPLRDEGDAYAHALVAAGVPTEHVQAQGHTHLSPTMVDLVVSGAPIRTRIAGALRGLLAGQE